MFAGSMAGTQTRVGWESRAAAVLRLSTYKVMSHSTYQDVGAAVNPVVQLVGRTSGMSAGEADAMRARVPVYTGAGQSCPRGGFR
jgi:hypothetical protein